MPLADNRVNATGISLDASSEIGLVADPVTPCDQTHSLPHQALPSRCFINAGSL